MSLFSQYPLLPHKRVPPSNYEKQYWSDKNEYVRYLHGAYDSERSFMNNFNLKQSFHSSCRVCNQQQILEDSSQYEVEDNLKHCHQRHHQHHHHHAAKEQSFPNFNNQIHNGKTVSFSKPAASQASPYFHQPPSQSIYQQIHVPMNKNIPQSLPLSNPQSMFYFSPHPPTDLSRLNPWRIVNPQIVRVAPPIRFISHQPPVRNLPPQQLQRIQSPFFIQQRTLLPQSLQITKSLTSTPQPQKIINQHTNQISPLTLELHKLKKSQKTEKCSQCRYCEEEKSFSSLKRRHF